MPATATVSRVSATGLRLFGGAAMGGGVFTGVLAVLLLGNLFGWVAGGAIGVAGLAVGLLAWRAGAAQNASAASEERAVREHAVLTLAEQRGGVLTVTEVAQALGWSAVAADALLTAMADGTRVTVEVDDEGLLSWHFHEFARGAVARVRVADEGAPTLEVRATESADAKLLGREPKP